MKRILFLMVAVLAITGCSKDENDSIHEPESPPFEINSSEIVGNIKYESFLYEGNYHIVAYDLSKQKKIYEIKEQAETYIDDLGYGETVEYIPQGCYILEIVKKDDADFILVSLISSMQWHPNKFILKIKGGEIVKKKCFNNDRLDEIGSLSEYHFYPETVIDWYGDNIAFYTSPRTSGYNFGVMDIDLNKAYFKSSNTTVIDYITAQNYILTSENRMVSINNNLIQCIDVSQYYPIVWETEYTTEDIKVKSAKYSLSDGYVFAEVDAVNKEGTNKKFYIKANCNSGEISK